MGSVAVDVTKPLRGGGRDSLKLQMNFEPSPPMPDPRIAGRELPSKPRGVPHGQARCPSTAA
jgi:hypothetical protein